jgi:cephalosporin hydroxylase
MGLAEAFRREKIARVRDNASNASLLESAGRFLVESIRAAYSYNFEWLSRPIIQYPQDVVAMQQLIWEVRPDLIIETGIAHGGSVIMTASMLALLDYCDAVQAGRTLDPGATRRRVLGIDIDIRPHNRAAIEAHPMAHRIDMIEGSSIAPEVVAQVLERAKGYSRIIVCLDSNHTHDHVLAELEAYAPLVSLDSYCVVFDTIIEKLPDDMFPDRSWGRGNNPLTAVQRFLSMVAAGQTLAADGGTLQFQMDSRIDSTLLVSVAPHGYLRRIPYGA